MSKFTIRVRRHEFNITCDKEEEDIMHAAAQLVEDKIDNIRAKSRVSDGERAAVMAALLIAFEAQKPSANSYNDSKLIGEMTQRIEDALNRTNGPLQGRAI
ncbi:cell division protein ZapA [Candidatus Persebacteraceae bacterium Df01]|jgi:cell division protein ZapA (FtsZ GTPase activity inhibitor)|uniref:Cell division protein ZapA n=1 Tax=Candidatus Doriopsillibacter californiensis TaxID=2970740 RepID=A0ABT7QK32_9GAMM|nr:cell division protein ZapA [Candidatus Persebacteraceae bacterium Df01]